MVILEEAAVPAEVSLEEAEMRLRTLGLRTGDESTAWVREERDAH